MSLSLKERLLYHQIHPAKIASDLSAGAVGLVLIWRGRTLAGALAVLVPSTTASAILMSFADLQPYKDSAAGRYLRQYITAPNQVLRLASFGIMALGCRRHDRVPIVGGLLGVVACWFYGMLPLHGVASGHAQE